MLISPFIPGTSELIASWLGAEDLSWASLGEFGGLKRVAKPSILFAKLEDDFIEVQRARFAGSQAEREAAEKEAAAPLSPEEFFRTRLDLRVARVESVERHPDADKLYVLALSVGGEERQIVSGLVEHYSEDQLIGQNIVLVYNLKPAKLRGIKSNGMLLAASTENEKELEVLFLPDAFPGQRLSLDGTEPPEAAVKRITIDEFFSVPMRVEDYRVMIGATGIEVGGREIRTRTLPRGSVG